MSPLAEQMLASILHLPDEDRRAIYWALSETIEEEIPNPTLHPEWLGELNRRWEELKSGKVQGIPWEEVKRQCVERLDA